MVATVRGGIPLVRRETPPTSGQELTLPFYLHHLKIRNLGSQIAKLYFTAEDFAADVNYVTIPVAADTHPYGEWEGPVETHEGSRANLWVASVTAPTTLEIVLFQRRG